MNESVRKILVLAVMAVAVIAVLIFFGTIAETESVTSASGNTASKTIADLAYQYQGAMERPDYPSFSLGLPLMLQVILSCIAIVAMILIAMFMPGARRIVIWITVLVSIRHLLWRGLETLDLSNPIAIAISLTIYGAEILAFTAMTLGLFQVWGQTDREPISLAKYSNEQLPSVDVMLCTYNEPVSVLYRSLVGCKSMEYPNKQVYLLDDGNRPEMRDLALSLGVNYISREENVHAKAGNLNNALNQTNGDLVLVFDADHVPAISFLQEVVGFFMVDSKLGFVQTPQHFFTEDPFQRNLLASQSVNNEQDLFFHVIEAGNDYWGAAFFGGSGAIFRRQALSEIGGYAVETITEDVHTGMRLHARGWKSVFYNKDLAAGMAQESFADFIKQRLRWGRGMTQIFCLENPMLIGGLSLAQRLCYLSGIWYFFHGLPRLIFMLAPLCFLLFGYKTINAGFVEVLIYYLPSFTAIFLGYTIISRGVRHSFWSEVYEVAFCVWLTLTTALTFLSPKRAKFRVTPKGGISGRMNFNWRIVFPQVMIASLTIVGIGMALVRGMYTPEYAGGIYTNLFWSGYNLILLLGAIYVAQERPQFRLAPRVFRRVRCELKLLDNSIAVGYTTNVSESGLAVVFDEPVPVSGTVQVKIMDWEINETTILNAQVVRSQLNENRQHYLGFSVVNRSDEQHQKLIRHMFGSADVWRNDYVYKDSPGSFWDLALTPFRLSGQVERALKRKSLRFQATLSCVLNVDGRFIIGFSNDVSETGVSVFLKKGHGIELGQRLRVRVQWPDGQISEIWSKVMRLEDAGSNQHKVGLNFEDLTLEQRVMLMRQIYERKDNLVRVAPSVNRFISCHVIRTNGEKLEASSQEVSEMGMVLRFRGHNLPAPGESVQVALSWNNNEQTLYNGQIQDIVMQGGVPLGLLYFKNMDLKTIEDLSRRLHEPVESKAFETLIS